MKTIMLGALIGASLLAAAPALADTTTIAIQDITTHAGYTAANEGQTFSGTGFVGMYNDNQFNHLFGLEGQFSATRAQIDISAFQGATINSAFISFDMLDGGGNYPVTIGGSAGTGSIGYSFDGPAADYGTVTGGVHNGSNSFDITAILTAAVAANEDWLNLQFRSPNGNCCVYTYTYTGFGYGPDRANVRLTVDADAGSGAVPEPASWAMMLGGFGMIGGALRSRRKAEVSFG